jgi:tetratricopeptide (TPR) repeat protein
MKLADKQHRLLVQLVIASAVLAGAGFAAATVGRLADLRGRRVRQVAEWRATVRRLLRLFPGDALPRLSAIPDTALGPTPTRYTEHDRAPYVARPGVDERLAELLSNSGPPYPFVVLVGASKAGKSRTLAEAARKAFRGSDPEVIIPNGGEALAGLMRLDPPLPLSARPALVWLDDLTVADAIQLSADVLDEGAQRAVLVATMTDMRWDQVLNSGSDIEATARAALYRAVRVTLDFELTEAEQAQARQMYPDEDVRASIAETLVGGEQLVHKLRAGRDSEPAGFAIVQAAIDARRAGLSRPITDVELRSLYPLYLRRVRINLDPTTALFEQGLDWAKKPVASQVALIRPAGTEGGWDVLDYVIAVEDGQGGRPARPILDQVWPELLAVVSARDAFGLGVGAFLKHKTDTAVAAFRRALDSGIPEVIPVAATLLGLLLAGQRDVEGARAAYQATIDSGDTALVPSAATLLGLLLAGQRDVEGARAAFQMAVDSGDTALVPSAAANLGVLLAGQGDVEGARAAYQLAIDSDNTDAAPRAAHGLGVLLAGQGDVEGARAAYQAAIDSGHAEMAPMAALGLGLLLDSQGDREGAQAAYQLAVDSGDAEAGPRAVHGLGVLLAGQGDVEGARAAYQMAIDSGHAVAAPRAALALAALVGEQGDVEPSEDVE